MWLGGHQPPAHADATPSHTAPVTLLLTSLSSLPLPCQAYALYLQMPRGLAKARYEQEAWRWSQVRTRALLCVCVCVCVCVWWWCMCVCNVGAPGHCITLSWPAPIETDCRPTSHPNPDLNLILLSSLLTTLGRA